MTLNRTILTGALLCSLSITALAQKPRVGTRVDDVEKQPTPIAERAARVNSDHPLGKNMLEQRIERIRIQAKSQEAIFSFHLTQATVPIVEVGKRSPDDNLTFRPGYVVSTAFPVLGGKQQEHKVLLKNLKPGTLYYYVIKAASNDNKLINVTGTFTTPVQLSNPQGNPASN